MNINRAVNTAIDFCKKELIPRRETVKMTALYALGGFLSGRVFGFVSPMHGAIYLAASRTTYVAINHISNHAYYIACDKIQDLSRKIEPAFQFRSRSSKQESSFSGYVRSGRHLASSWMDSFRVNLGFIRRMSLSYTDIYLSHHMANVAVLSLLKMQPIAYRTAIKVVFSSTVLTIFAGSFIDFAMSEIKKRMGGEKDYY